MILKSVLEYECGHVSYALCAGWWVIFKESALLVIHYKQGKHVEEITTITCVNLIIYHLLEVNQF